MPVVRSQNSFQFVLFRAYFQVIFLPISDSKCQPLGLPKHGFRSESIAKSIFHGNRFLWISESNFIAF